MTNAFYFASVSNFVNTNNDSIFGIISRNEAYDSAKHQKDAWYEQIIILKSELKEYSDAEIAFEYTIPRIGGRIDNILLYKGIVFVIEFKVNANEYLSNADVQVRTYALDLSNFHEESHNRVIVPILVATAAPEKEIEIKHYNKNVIDVIHCNKNNIHSAIEKVISKYSTNTINLTNWLKSRYLPTPTIIEAAEELYKTHTVANIAKHDAAENLDATTEEVKKIIEYSKNSNKKSICFITGVPGAGKTLAGLNIAIENQKATGKDYACFLTGNQPLVTVLQEALAQDRNERLGEKITDARNKVKSFIQIIHHFRDTALIDMSKEPADNVVIFDEAQRAWHNNKLSKFMLDKKKAILNDLTDSQRQSVLSMSEPELLIEYMDRKKDWAVIVCLVGGGQDINDGESGIGEWFDSIKRSFPHWEVFVSDQITSSEYVGNSDFSSLTCDLQCILRSSLHLSVTIRSFRSEKVSEFVTALIDNNIEQAKALYQDIKLVYPLVMTRNLTKAKNWVVENAQDTNARYGVIASSRAKRLRAEGIWVECKVKPDKWFLNDKNDIKSSYFMEEAATEFDIQGLEIDWAVACWDADFRYNGSRFEYKETNGSKWQTIHKDEDRRYLKNAYRVLLTRARQGLVIFVPNGNKSDHTRLPEFYDELYFYLKRVGIEEI